jgi:hypothetical protein
MLRIMRDPAQAVKRRDEMARAAAPYVHARLMAAKMEPKPKKNLADCSSAEIRAEMIKKFVTWGLIPQLTEEENQRLVQQGIIPEPIEVEKDHEEAARSTLRRVSSPRHRRGMWRDPAPRFGDHGATYRPRRPEVRGNRDRL